MKELSRNQMKQIKGGDDSGSGCSMTFQDTNGTWHTEQGSCQNYIVYGGYIPYCQTNSFSTPVSLTSNGGTSKCGSAVYSG
jgi:hypothetical protein